MKQAGEILALSKIFRFDITRLLLLSIESVSVVLR